MKSKYHHGDLAPTLVTVALDILSESGVQNMSLREVARRAGVSATAPYRHFADKEALLSAAAVEGFSRLRQCLLGADAAGAGLTAIAAQGAAYVQFALDNPALFRIMFGPKPLAGADHFEAAGEAAYAVLINRVERTWPQAQPLDARALAYWSLIHGFTVLAMDGRLGQKEEPLQLITQLVTLFAPGAQDASG